MLLLLIAIAVCLFYPVYDLDISRDINWKNHTVVETNFISLESCRTEANKYQSADWLCLKKTGWGQLTNKYSKYDSKHQ